MSTPIYHVKKRDIELITDDQDLVMRILGIKEEQQRTNVVKPKREACKIEKQLSLENIEETATSYRLGRRESVSKACVNDVLAFVKTSEKPVGASTIRQHLPGYSQPYINRALRLLTTQLKIRKLRVPDRRIYVYEAVA